MDKSWRVWTTGVRPRCHACQSQDSHQSLNPFAVDDMPFDAQMHDHLAAAVEWVERIFGINQRKYQFFFVRYGDQKRDIKGRTGNAS